MGVDLDVEAVLSHPAVLAEFCWFGPGEPFALWPYQERLLGDYLAHRRVVTLKARQLGWSWTGALYLLWGALRFPAQKGLALSIGQAEADGLLGKVRTLYDSLPAYVRQARPLVSNSRSELAFGGHGGRKTKYPPGVIWSLPSSRGRGETAHRLLGDEVAFWERSDERLAAVLPTAGDVGQVILGSTAAGMHGRFFHLYSGAPDNGWHAVFVGALDRPDRDPAWLAAERTGLGDLGPQEYPLSADEAFVSSGRGAFDHESLLWLRQNSCRPAPWRGVLERDTTRVIATRAKKGLWRLWESPKQGRAYLISADSCQGPGGRDYAHAVIMDRESWDQVGCLHGRIPPHELARELILASYLFPDPAGRPALLVPEANNHGQATLVHLRSHPNVWVQERFDQRVQKATNQRGWLTDMKNKPAAVGQLGAALKLGNWGVRDTEAVAEMQVFEYQADPERPSRPGRFGAAGGMHDDRVMAHAIACGVLSLSPRGGGSIPREGDVTTVAYRPRDPITGY